MRQLWDSLRAQAADRPAHREYIERIDKMIAADPVAAALNDLIHDIPLPPNVSQRVAEAITEDVDWLLWFDHYIEEPGVFTGGYSNVYRDRRITDARAANARVRTAARKGPKALTELFDDIYADPKEARSD